MLALSSGLLRTGLALKLNQIKRATRSYLRDRANEATGTATSYAVAAGMFATAGIFLIAALLVGVTALFRWLKSTTDCFRHSARSAPCCWRSRRPAPVWRPAG